MQLQKLGREHPRSRVEHLALCCTFLEAIENRGVEELSVS
jgi:hypothetical protein